MQPTRNGTGPSDEVPTDQGSTGPITAATDRLVHDVSNLGDGELSVPSRCPGWTRAHVLAHVARNADALANLLRWASTGVETPMYPSREQRNADIAAGAERTVDELVDDLIASARRFSAAVSQVPDDRWEREVRLGPGGSGRTVAARHVLWLRLKEVEIHHVDLDTSYSPGDWQPQFVSRALAETLQMFSRREDAPSFTVVVDGRREPVGDGGSVTVQGPASAVLGWLTGRTPGQDLRVQPAGQLPSLPPWA